MANSLKLSSLLLLYSWLSATNAANTVTIDANFSKSGHSCIKRCLWYPNVVGQDVNDLGSILDCGYPYNNECYCPTATASASMASKYIDSCASSRCQKGDLSLDLGSMRSFYASYCMDNGFTQAGVTAWVPAAATSSFKTSAASTDKPEPTATGDSGAPQTTTQLTIVTATTDASGGSKSRVVVQQTSTVWIGPDGNIVSGPGTSSNDNSKKNLGIGLGVGIPVAVIVAAVISWLCVRRRRRNTTPSAGPEMSYGYEQPTVGELPHQASAYQQGAIDRKPVASVSPATVSTATPVQGNVELPSPGVGGHGYTHGYNEVSGQSRPHEMMAGNQNQRWELSAQ